MKIVQLKYIAFAIIASIFASCSNDVGGLDKSANPNGEGGSMARMTIVNDYLYTVDNQDLKVFNISDPSQVVFVKSVEIGRNIETLFGFKNSLYIGSGNAVYIYSISNPENPTQLEMIQHTYSCDPVVANDTIAFSTVRTTSTCRRNNWSANELLILDVSSLSNIHETHNYNLDFEPYGIGLEDTIFFLCKGEAGIDVFDSRDFFKNIFANQLPPTINTITGINAFDVIPYNDLLIVVGETGMILYDIKDIHNIKKLSGIYPD